MLSCATSSFRKRSSETALLVLDAVLPVVVAELLALTAVVLVMVCVCPVRGATAYWPSCKVLSNNDLAVFMTSTLFWYERDAEIMLTISSTVLTLDWLT
mgnify:CR=1 FL=1